MATDTDALEGPLKKVYTQYKWALIWLYGAKVYIIYNMGSMSYKSSIQIFHITTNTIIPHIVSALDYFPPLNTVKSRVLTCVTN